jgi:hypothetical protein
LVKEVAQALGVAAAGGKQKLLKGERGSGSQRQRLLEPGICACVPRCEGRKKCNGEPVAQANQSRHILPSQAWLAAAWLIAERSGLG